MMKKTLIATATAGLIAAGTMVATTGTASAAGMYFGGPGWSVGIGDGEGHGWRRHHARQVCEPVYRTVRWWDHWGRPHVRQVVVDQECHWTRGWGGPGPNPGWAYGGDYRRHY